MNVIIYIYIIYLYIYIYILYIHSIIRGKQYIFLHDDCVIRRGGYGIVLHELMHTLGFYHEHQRPDRGTHIHVSPDLINNTDYRVEQVEESNSPYDMKCALNIILQYCTVSYNSTLNLSY